VVGAGYRARDLAEVLGRTALVVDGVRGDLGGWSGPLRVEVERSLGEIVSDLAGISSSLSWRGARIIEVAGEIRARRSAMAAGTPPGEVLRGVPGAGGRVPGGSWSR